MSSYNFHVDDRMAKEIDELKEFFNASSKADVLERGIALLKIAKEVEEEEGKLVAKKGDKEVRIKVL